MNPERLFDSNLEEKEIRDIFSFYGFKDCKQADQNLVSLIRILGGDVFFLKSSIARIFGILKNISDPDRAFQNFIIFLEHTPSPFMNFNFIIQNLSVSRLLFRLFSESQFFTNILVRHPDYFDWLVNKALGVEKSRDDLLGDALSSLEPFQTNEAKFMALRRFQKREFLRIGTNDILKKSSIETTTCELSHLADICIEVIYRIQKEEIFSEEENGEQTDLTVISMGKMGGEELNYSSDIDILFVGQGNLNLCVKLAQMLIKELSRVTEEGSFYRVDTRLRPEGDRGQLVRNLEGFTGYFENRARIWERQAYLKARYSAGNRELGKQFLKVAENFVFKKYLTIEEINTIKRLKKSIEGKALQKKQWKREVKIGYGGIRDIEFFIQLIQLLYGGRYPELKTRNSFRALNQLQKLGFISFHEYSTLYNHYSFLRQVEHFLQIMEYRQTHLLPDGETDKGILAIKMGFDSRKEFEAHYEEVTREVRSIFQKYFEGIFEEKKENITEEIFRKSEMDPEVTRILENYGFKDTHRIFHLIQNTGMNAKNEMLFFSVLEDVFEALKQKAFHPDRGLVNLLRIIQAYRGQDVFFDIIKKNTNFLNTLVKIASFSDFIVEIIEKNPAVLDFLTETMVLEQRANRKELLQILRSLREDLSLEKALSTLFEMEIFRIGSQDMLDLRPWPKIGSSLSTLAETILFGAFEEHLKPRPDLQYAVIFLGKMAGKELSYNSDLDMVVLSKDENYESVSFLTSLVHKVIKSVKGIYEIDLRLRPNGKNAPLVVPISAFRKYLEEKGENWERMVYSRNLIYASSPELVREVKGMIRKFTDSRPPDFRESIIEMREKIAANFPPENFKKHYGGIIDIEFITEYLKIFHALKDSNILALMESIRKKDLFPAELLTKMNKGYAFLRKLENSIRLLSNHYSSSLPENEEFRKILAMKLGFSGYENFFSHYKAMREGIRECWDYFRSEVSK